MMPRGKAGAESEDRVQWMWNVIQKGLKCGWKCDFFWVAVHTVVVGMMTRMASDICTQFGCRSSGTWLRSTFVNQLCSAVSSTQESWYSCWCGFQLLPSESHLQSRDCAFSKKCSLPSRCSANLNGSWSLSHTTIRSLSLFLHSFCSLLVVDDWIWGLFQLIKLTGSLAVIYATT